MEGTDGWLCIRVTGSNVISFFNIPILQGDFEKREFETSVIMGNVVKLL